MHGPQNVWFHRLLESRLYFKFKNLQKYYRIKYVFVGTKIFIDNHSYRDLDDIIFKYASWLSSIKER